MGFAEVGAGEAVEAEGMRASCCEAFFGRDTSGPAVSEEEAGRIAIARKMGGAKGEFDSQGRFLVAAKGIHRGVVTR